MGKSNIACILAIFLFISSHGATIHQQDTSKLPKIQWDELNPRAVGFVKDYLEIHEARLTNMKSWGQPYFIMIESVLNRYHLPPSLKYLPSLNQTSRALHCPLQELLVLGNSCQAPQKT